VVKKELSLKALSGEMVALIGENGIGKSTLLKTIAGFQSPLAGALLINNKIASDYSSEELAREMSFVSTGIVRVANLTVREMVGLGRFPFTNWFGTLSAYDHIIIRDAIERVGLSGYEDRLINRISDGERQRAMIARALAQDTPIMVLDEPTAFLDISNKYEIVSILHKLAEEHGKCILFSTHDLNTALTMADRIWLMLNDQVIEGIPEEVAAKGYFEGLFPNNSQLYYDPEKGDFRLRKENRGVVILHASGSELFWATRAMERLGFEVKFYPPSRDDHKGLLQQSSGIPDSRDSGSPDTLQVSHSTSGWKLKNEDQSLELQTLEELVRVIKKITLRQLS
jgi:iron complex transport system ATP-binding protein